MSHHAHCSLLLWDKAYVMDYLVGARNLHWFGYGNGDQLRQGLATIAVKDTGMYDLKVILHDHFMVDIIMF